jgi:hypothetical protein
VHLGPGARRRPGGAGRRADARARIRLWAGKFGVLILKFYKWRKADQRLEFAKNLCVGEPALCAHAKIVRSLRVAPASFAYFVALRKDGRRQGEALPVLGVDWSYFLDPSRDRLGSDAWGPRGRALMIEFTCLAGDPAKQGKPQNRCVVHAMQRADLNPGLRD